MGGSNVHLSLKLTDIWRFFWGKNLLEKPSFLSPPPSLCFMRRWWVGLLLRLSCFFTLRSLVPAEGLQKAGWERTTKKTGNFVCKRNVKKNLGKWFKLAGSTLEAALTWIIIGFRKHSSGTRQERWQCGNVSQDVSRTLWDGVDSCCLEFLLECDFSE